MEERTKGLIVSALGGFYYVAAKARRYECRARGLFRLEGKSPLVGDDVDILITGEGTGSITEIHERVNEFLRPPVANVKRLVMVVSITSPPPNLQIIDKLIAVAEYKGIEPVVALTKSDLATGDECGRFYELYNNAGFRVFNLSSKTGEGVDSLREYLSGGINCLCGNTGAGKSSLLNVLEPGLELKTGEISRKLGRGRHTTRHAELYELPSGGYIADTPGFSSVEISRYETILKESLQDCFREFEPYKDKCRFRGCSHTSEPGCAVLAAVGSKAIAKSRHDSYAAMYEEAKRIKEWELTKK